MDTHLPPFWAEHLVAVLGGKARPETLRFLHAWARAEGGTASWNPLNTTMKLPGSSDVIGNSAGVQNYPRPVWGVCATAITLTSPALGKLRYGLIVGLIQSGIHTAEEIVDLAVDELAQWGTSVALLRQVLKETP